MTNKSSKSKTAVFRHQERKYAAENNGTASRRVGANSQKRFDACGLCLHTATEPLACPQGDVFCKSCVYEALLSQKQHQKRQLAAWEAQQAKRAAAATDAAAASDATKLAAFAALESSVVGNNATPSSSSLSSSSSSSSSSPSLTVGGAVELQSTKDSHSAYDKIVDSDGKVSYVVNRERVATFAKSSEDTTDADRAARAKFMPSFW
jgi:nitric oxide synthase-interacting protein